MAKCDLCSARCSASGMIQLRPQYQVEGIVDLCKPCASWVDQTKNDLLDEVAPRVRAAIQECAGRPPRVSFSAWLKRGFK